MRVEGAVELARAIAACADERDDIAGRWDECYECGLRKLLRTFWELWADLFQAFDNRFLRCVLQVAIHRRLDDEASRLKLIRVVALQELPSELVDEIGRLATIHGAFDEPEPSRCCFGALGLVEETRADHLLDDDVAAVSNLARIAERGVCVGRTDDGGEKRAL